MKLRLVLPVLLAALAALLVAGCGGGSDSGGSGTDPASVAPARAPLFIDYTVRPEGETKENIDALAKEIAGVDNLGELIVEELENSANDEGEELDFEKEVEPWLGDRGGIFLQEFEDEDFEGYGVAFQTDDEGASKDFIDEQLASEDEVPEEGSYEGVDFNVEADDGTTIGVFDGLVVIAEDEDIFKTMVDASNGENLGGEANYTDAVANVPGESAANVYVDIGTLIEESGGEIDSETETFLDSAGIEPKEATAVASLVPGSKQVEVDLSSDLSGDNPPSGDASELLGSLPATSVAALASDEFGKRFDEAIDRIDKEGIPSEGIEPNQLKKGLKEAGIDLESIASSIGDVGVYVTGNSEKTLGGAMVLESDSAKEATATVSNIGLLLRSTGTPGVTKISEGASGFSVRSPELGRQPVVVVAKDSKIAIGYGLAPTLSSFQEANKTLSDAPAYQDALASLGDTPITMFVDGPSALNLATALVPSGEECFEEAKPYLQKIEYLALGSEASDGLATAKLIVGLK
ncbi:MAG TPA: DUF3352 domain-containing protein [Solirubrobacterales bacterium]|nr:DUF3352 domain-containing protein [Solirubrobacterales bacterium]